MRQVSKIHDPVTKKTTTVVLTTFYQNQHSVHCLTTQFIDISNEINQSNGWTQIMTQVFNQT